MEISELKKEYQYAKLAENMPEEEKTIRNIKFINLLLKSNASKVLEYHYDLLKEREYKELYYDIRAAFKRRMNIENFLVEKSKLEKDEIVIGDILHILGGVKSKFALLLAQENENSKNKYLREVSLYVLGWMGDKNEIKILNKHMLEEKEKKLRITAASAHRQIYFRNSELKNELLISLKEGFYNEKDDDVIEWIIIMIETIGVKRLGLKEEKTNPDVVIGDLDKAKLKTKKYLEQLG